VRCGETGVTAALQELAGSQELLKGAGVTAALGAETLLYLGHQTRHLAPPRI